MMFLFVFFLAVLRDLMLPEDLEEVPEIDFDKQFTYEACSKHVIRVWHMLGRAEGHFSTLFTYKVWLLMIFNYNDYKEEAQRSLIRHFIDWYLWQFQIKDVETDCYISGIIPDDSSPKIDDMARETIVLVSKIREKHQQSEEDVENADDDDADDEIKEKKLGVDETKPTDSVEQQTVADGSEATETSQQSQADVSKIKTVSANERIVDSSNVGTTIALASQQQADATKSVSIPSTGTHSLSTEPIVIVPHVATAHSPVQQKQPGSIQSVLPQTTRVVNNVVPSNAHIVDSSTASDTHSELFSPIHTTNSVPQKTDKVVSNAVPHHLASRPTVRNKPLSVPNSPVHAVHPAHGSSASGH